MTMMMGVDDDDDDNGKDSEWRLLLLITMMKILNKIIYNGYKQDNHNENNIKKNIKMYIS